jgi:Collagen triple helix repeat (20 copies)
MEELFSPDELEDVIGTVVVVGEDGQPGTPGADGTDGVDGSDGADGADGVDGRPGEDVVIVNGTGTDEELLDLLVDLLDLEGAGFETVPEPDPDGRVATGSSSAGDLYL